MLGGRMAFQVLREMKDRAMAAAPRNKLVHAKEKLQEMPEAKKTAEIQRSVEYDKHRTPPLAYFDHR